MFRPLDDSNKPGRIHGFSRWIEKDLARTHMLGKYIEPYRHDLAHLTIGITRAPLQKLSGHRIRVDVSRFADVVDEDLQSSTVK